MEPPGRITDGQICSSAGREFVKINKSQTFTEIISHQISHHVNDSERSEATGHWAADRNYGNGGEGRNGAEGRGGEGW